MRTFGSNELTWRDDRGVEHVIVAVRGSGWRFLCHADPDRYETVERDPGPTAEPWVWKHDRRKVDCQGCLAVLDGAVVRRVTVSL